MKDAPGKVTFLHRNHLERGKSYFSPLICMCGFTAWIPEFRTVRWERTREPLTPGDTLLHKMGTSTAVGPPAALWGLLPLCLQLCRWIWLEEDTAMLAGLTLNQWPYALLVWPQVITAPGGALGAAPLTILSLQIHFSLAWSPWRLSQNSPSSLKPSTPSPLLTLLPILLRKEKK